MSARKDARKKAGDVHGIAAAFGGAKDIFNSTLSKGSGDEMGAMFKKTANDNQRSNQSDSNTRSSPQTQSTRSVPPFRPNQRPDDGTSRRVSSNSTNQSSSPSELVKNTFSGQDLTKPANDNQQTGGNIKATAAKKAPEQEVRDIRRLDQRVQDAIGTPELLPKDASANLSGQLAESINDPTKIRDKDSEDGRDPQYEYLNFDNDNENFDNSEIERLNNQITISEDILDDTLNENDKDEERITAHKVNFPFIMFVLSLLEWILLLILSLVAIVLTFILPPAGLIIGTSIRFWKIAFRVFISSWCIFYEKKEIANVKKLFSKSKRIAQISTRKSISTYTIWIFTILPFIGDIFPYNTYSVWESYSKLKKTIRKY